jgi:hypothetical protein
MISDEQAKALTATAETGEAGIQLADRVGALRQARPLRFVRSVPRMAEIWSKNPLKNQFIFRQKVRIRHRIREARKWRSHTA